MATMVIEAWVRANGHAMVNTADIMDVGTMMLTDPDHSGKHISRKLVQVSNLFDQPPNHL